MAFPGLERFADRVDSHSAFVQALDEARLFQNCPAPLDSHDTIRMGVVPDLPVLPSSQTQEARAVRDLRIRPARIEGAVS